MFPKLAIVFLTYDAVIAKHFPVCLMGSSKPNNQSAPDPEPYRRLQSPVPALHWCADVTPIWRCHADMAMSRRCHADVTTMSRRCHADVTQMSRRYHAEVRPMCRHGSHTSCFIVHVSLDKSYHIESHYSHPYKEVSHTPTKMSLTRYLAPQAWLKETFAL
jgi:hypothetical protein